MRVFIRLLVIDSRLAGAELLTANANPAVQSRSQCWPPSKISRPLSAPA